MTAKNNMSAARKRPSSSKNKNTRGSGLRRFLFGAVAAALASFQIASCTLDPGWNERLNLPKLSTLPIPGLESGKSAPTPPPGGVSTGFSQCREFFPGGEPPVLPPRPLQRDLCFSNFAVLHSGETKTPIFAAERLNRSQLKQGQGLKRGDRFYADARLPSAERAELADYKGSGYSRGHMAPAADMYSPEGMAQSFSLANMVPQDQTHNGGVWSKVEQDTRSYAMRAQGDVYVFTGPVFDGPAATIGQGKVHVPSHLFKLVYDASAGRAWVHWQANRSDTRMSEPISYEEFTRRTGLHLLPASARTGG